jgi:hypothetical protein
LTSCKALAYGRTDRDRARPAPTRTALASLASMRRRAGSRDVLQ